MKQLHIRITRNEEKIINELIKEGQAESIQDAMSKALKHWCTKFGVSDPEDWPYYEKRNVRCDITQQNRRQNINQAAEAIKDNDNEEEYPTRHPMEIESEERQDNKPPPTRKRQRVLIDD